jgi:hypothetical protein
MASVTASGSACCSRVAAPAEPPTGRLIDRLLAVEPIMPVADADDVSRLHKIGRQPWGRRVAASPLTQR